MNMQNAELQSQYSASLSKLSPDRRKDVENAVQALNDGTPIFHVPAELRELVDCLPLNSETKDKLQRTFAFHDVAILNSMPEMAGMFQTPKAAGMYKVFHDQPMDNFELARISLIVIPRTPQEMTEHFRNLQNGICPSSCADGVLEVVNGRTHFISLTVTDQHKRLGLATAVMGIATYMKNLWWAAATSEGKALSDSLVRKGVARSLGNNAPDRKVDKECFEFIKQRIQIPPVTFSPPRPAIELMEAIGVRPQS